MSTNIKPEHISAFEAMTSGEYGNFALFSCFVNGTPTSAICAVTKESDDNYIIAPLFVALVPDMVLTDHDGVRA